MDQIYQRNPMNGRQCEAREKSFDDRVRLCQDLPLGGNMSLHDYCLKCSKNLCQRHLRRRCSKGGLHQPSEESDENRRNPQDETLRELQRIAEKVGTVRDKLNYAVALSRIGKYVDLIEPWAQDRNFIIQLLKLPIKNKILYYRGLEISDIFNGLIQRRIDQEARVDETYQERSSNAVYLGYLPTLDLFIIGWNVIRDESYPISSGVLEVVRVYANPLHLNALAIASEVDFYNDIYYRTEFNYSRFLQGRFETNLPQIRTQFPDLIDLIKL